MSKKIDKLETMGIDWMVDLEMLRYDLNIKFDRLMETV